MSTGYLGPKMSYSFLATSKMGYNDGVPFKTIFDLFDAVEKGGIDRAVVPVENSLEGQVGQTLDLLFSKDVSIIEEYYLRVVHCIAATDNADVKIVHSHPQALMQCSNYIEKHGYAVIEETSTTAGIEKLFNEQNKGHAVICSEEAASACKLTILDRDIGNEHDNFTRFFVITKKGLAKPQGDKISIAFTLLNKPGSLASIVDVLAKYGIDMTKIESRPIKFNPFSYIFYIDFIDNGFSKQAMDEISQKTVSLKILGKYRKAIGPVMKQ
ncbi:prephenate dehydratase [Thermoplasma volcanium GSS1]|uniref:Prephenate dehydratase n=1 Tax=Thermoplasma volcanium (strain ATCC 51530 / DSM 4299 / JCM 9571 / NBRC 15438 / GSS1) TaxID=273116 RepID=Q97AD5_THEVO|nr:prephenate dehydratase [Thermoplasma volcanium]BAB60017.1 prephenate dehydratase [Thermoplasma volcanium GSS1]